MQKTGKRLWKRLLPGLLAAALAFTGGLSLMFMNRTKAAASPVSGTPISAADLAIVQQYWEFGVPVNAVLGVDNGAGGLIPLIAECHPNGNTAASLTNGGLVNTFSGPYGMRHKATGKTYLIYGWTKADGTVAQAPQMWEASGAGLSSVPMNIATLSKPGAGACCDISYYDAARNALKKDAYGNVFIDAYMTSGGTSRIADSFYLTSTGMSTSAVGEPLLPSKVDASIESKINTYPAYNPAYTGRSVEHPLAEWLRPYSSQVTVSGQSVGAVAGTYTMTVTPAGDYTWQDGSKTPKQITWSIAQAEQTGTLDTFRTIALSAQFGTFNVVGNRNFMPSGSSGDACYLSSGYTYSVSSGAGYTIGADGAMTVPTRIGASVVTVSNPGNANLKAKTWTVNVATTLQDGFYIGDLASGARIYPTLQEAYNALLPGESTIHVKGNVIAFGTLNVDKSIIIAGDPGAKITRLTGDSVISVGKSGVCEIKGLTIDGANANGSPIITSEGTLIFSDKAELRNGKAESGGALSVTGGTAVLTDVTFRGNTATGNGGAVAISAGADVTVGNAVFVNNRASGVGDGVYVTAGGTLKVSLSESGSHAITDGVGIGYDESTGTSGQIRVSGKTIASRFTVEFENPEKQTSEMTQVDGAWQIQTRRTYVTGDTNNTSDNLKAQFRVQNAGYTFEPNPAGEDDPGLALVRSLDIVAILMKDGKEVLYYDCNTAIADAQDPSKSDDKTVYFVSHEYQKAEDAARSTDEVVLTEPLVVTGDVKFGSARRTVGTDGTTVTWNTNPDSPTVLKRGENLTDELLRVEGTGNLEIGKLTLDGGAIWDGGVIKLEDDGQGGAGTVATNNTGLIAHAPVIVNRGTLALQTGATVQNNENNLGEPGVGFGSEHYGGGVRNEAKGKLTVDGATIQLCYAREGGAILNVNKPTAAGGAYAADGNPTVTVQSGTLQNNASQQKGAAIQTIYGGAETTVQGGTITGNWSLHDLGVLSVEEGGSLTVKGGSVATSTGAMPDDTPVTNENAIYLYNHYAKEDYAAAEAGEKPFLEGTSEFNKHKDKGDNVGKLSLSANPTVTGKVHLDNPCFVADPNDLSQDSAVYYGTYVDVTGLTADITLALEADRAYGVVAHTDTGSTTGETELGHLGLKDEIASDGRSGSFYAYVNHDGGLDARLGGFSDLQFVQTGNTTFTVSGICDPDVKSVKFFTASNEIELSFEAEDGKFSGELDLGTYSSARLEALFADDDNIGRLRSGYAYGDGTEKTTGEVYASFAYVSFDAEKAMCAAPEGTMYLATDGTWKALADPESPLPNDILLEGGNAQFRVPARVAGLEFPEAEQAARTLHLGNRAADPTDLQAMPLYDLHYPEHSMTVTSLSAEPNLEYNVLDVETGKLVFADWQQPEEGKIVFDWSPSTPEQDRQYTIVARTKAGTDEIASRYFECPNSTYTVLPTAEEPDKEAFDKAFDTAKASGLLERTDGSVTSEPKHETDAELKVYKDALDAYEALSDTAKALPAVIEKVRALNETYDYACAEKWRGVDHQTIIEQAQEILDGTPAPTDPGELSAMRENITKACADYNDSAKMTTGARELALPEYNALLDVYGGLVQAELEAYAETVTSEPSSAFEGKRDNYLQKIAVASTPEEQEFLLESAKAVLGVQNHCDELLEDGTLTDLTKDRLADLVEQAQEAIDAADSGEKSTEEEAAKNALDRVKAAADAEREYATSYRLLKGEELDPSAPEVREAFAAIEAADDNAGRNSALADAVKDLLDSIRVTDADGNDLDSDAVSNYIDDIQTAVSDTASAAGTDVAKVSEDLDGVKDKIDADRAAERQAALQTVEERYAAIVKAADDIYAQERAAAEEIRDDAIAALEDTLGGKKLDEIVKQAVKDLNFEEQKGRIKQDYLDSYAALTGKTPETGASPVKDALDAIEAAADPALGDDKEIVSMLEAEQTHLEPLCDALVTAEDSAAVQGLVTDVKSALESEIDAQIAVHQAANCRDVVKDLRTEIDAQRQSEREAAKADVLAERDTILAEEETAGRPATPATQKRLQAVVDAANAEIDDAANQTELDGIVAEAKAKLRAVIAAAGAVQDYLDCYALLNGKEADLDDPTVQAACAAIEAESDAIARNGAAQPAVEALIDGLYAKDAAGGETDSPEAKAILEAAQAAIEAEGNLANGESREADFSAALTPLDTRTKLDAQRQSEREAARQRIENAYRELTESAPMLEEARARIEQIARDAAAALDEVLGKLEMDAIADTAEESIRRIGAEGIAKQDYLDSYREILLVAANPNDAATQAIFAKIEAAADVQGMNAIVRAEADALLAPLVRGGDSAAAKAIVEKAQAAVAAEATAAGTEARQADFSEQVKGVRQNLEAQRRNEREAAKRQIENAYRDVTDRSGDKMSEDSKARLDRQKDDAIARAGGAPDQGTLNGIVDGAKRDFARTEAEGVGEQRYFDAYESLLEREADPEDALVKSVLDDIHGAADKAEIDRIVDDAIEALRKEVELDQFLKDHPVATKDYASLTGEDKPVLEAAREDFAALDEALRAYFDERLGGEDADGFAGQLSDRAAKAEFEAKKAETRAAAEALAEEGDERRETEALERGLDAIDAVEYEPQRDEAARAAELSKRLTELSDALTETEREVAHGRNRTRFAENARKEYDRHIETGKYGCAQVRELQTFLDEFVAQADGVPASADDTTQRALDALFEAYRKALDEVAIAYLAQGGFLPDGSFVGGQEDTVSAHVANEFGVPAAAELVVTRVEIADEHNRALQKKTYAADGFAAEQDALSGMVKGKELEAVYDVALLLDGVRVDRFEGVYRVRILLPDALKNVDGLQVVSVDAEGNLVVHQTTRNGDSLVFDTSVLTEFLVLGEGILNLWWLIITLSVILALEWAAILCLRRQKEDKESERTRAVLPLSLLLIVIPKHGILICILLGIAVLATTAVLVLRLLSRKRIKKSERDDSNGQGD